MVTTDAPPVPITAKVSYAKIGGDFFFFKVIITQSNHNAHTRMTASPFQRALCHPHRGN
jgi:hypothetical protein